VSRKVHRRATHADLTRPVFPKNEEFLLELLEREPEPFLLVLDSVQDPHNLGACLRSADAAGCHAVIAPRDRAATLTDTVRRIACGGAEHLPFVQVTNLARCLDQLRDRFVRLVGTGDEEARSLHETRLTGPLALVMGAEETGLRRLTAEKCDELISIPMLGHVACLNVSVATGVCLFEAVRQRRAAE
jgi:23S rRNA (guanosine2251-2'-O)-methyltransferase